MRPEEITNRSCSLEFGLAVDSAAGSSEFSKPSLYLILQPSVKPMTDAEWTMIVRRIGKGSIGYHTVEGLEYVEDTAVRDHIEHRGQVFYVAPKGSVR